MSCYRVALYGRSGTPYVATVIDSLSDAARAAIALANFAHDVVPEELNDDGAADVEVSGPGGVELSPAETDRLRALLAEHGADPDDTLDSDTGWNIP